MNLRLRTKKSPSDEVRRLARRELGKAATVLVGRKQRRESVHAARKHVKKVRALLRLVQQRTGAKFFRKENRALRELGQKLSAVRDAQVILVVLDDLRRANPTGRIAEVLTKVRAGLNPPAEATASPDVSPGEARSCAREFERRRRGVKRWPLGKLAWPELAAALARSHRRSQDALARYAEHRTLLNLHEWRKRAKDFFYQLLILESLVPRELRSLAGKVASLTELQGAAHDLDLLLTALDRLRDKISATERNVVRELAQKRLRSLAARALKQGRKTFRLSPEQFVERLRTHPS